jgi:hypothetical protein
LVGAHGAHPEFPFGDAAFLGDFRAFARWRIHLALGTAEAEEKNE